MADLLDRLREAGAADTGHRAGRAAIRRPRPPRRPVTPWPQPAGQAAGGGRARTRSPRWPSRDPAAHVPSTTPAAAARLLDSLREAGARDQVTALLAAIRPPTPPSTTRPPWPGCWTRCGTAGAGGPSHRAGRACRRPRRPRRPVRRSPAAGQAAEGGRGEQVTVLAERAAAHAPLDDPDAVAELLAQAAGGGRGEQVTVLAERAAAHVPLDDPNAVGRAAARLRTAGAAETGHRRWPWARVRRPRPPSTTRDARGPRCWTAACGPQGGRARAGHRAGRARRRPRPP